MKVSVIIPAYNEKKRLPRSLRIISNYLLSHALSYEIIVVSDGSTDNTAQTVKKMGLENIRLVEYHPNRGKGYAVRMGFQEAAGDVVLLSDADLSTPISEYGKLFSYFQKGYEVVLGSRGLPESEVKLPQKCHRRFMGKTFNSMVQLFIVRGFQDTQCGFKLLSGKAVKEILPRMTLNGFAFDVELVLIAQKSGFKIIEVPVKWYNSPESRVLIWRDPLRMFAELFSIFIRSKTGKYEKNKTVS